MVHDLLGQAYSSLEYNRRRSALTMLGMAWGIATVVLLLAYGAGFERAIENIFGNFGAKLIGLFPGRTSMQAGGSKAGVQVRLKLDDVERISTQVPLVKHISPMCWLNGASVQKDVRNFKWEVDGVYPAFQQIRSVDVDRGRFFNQDELIARSRVAVLSSDAKTKLFSGQFAIGDTIRINGMSFQVIGYLKPKMQEGNDNINNVIYIPFTAMGDLKNTEYVDAIWLDYEGMEYEKVEHEVKTVLGKEHNFDPKDK